MKQKQSSNFFYAVTVILCVGFIFCFGCGLIANMGTESPREKKIPAEFKLADKKGKKILVLVNQPVWLGAPPVLRGELADMINRRLVENAKINSGSIIDYKTLSDFRSKRVDFSMMSEAQVGKALGADLVLLLVLDGYTMNKLADTDYYKGSLEGQAGLIEVETDKKLWPEKDSSRVVRVGFEVEVRGAEIALSRLANSMAYCVTRYFYDCPKDKFKIADDRSGVAWEIWND